MKLLGEGTAREEQSHSQTADNRKSRNHLPPVRRLDSRVGGCGKGMNRQIERGSQRRRRIEGSHAGRLDSLDGSEANSCNVCQVFLAPGAMLSFSTNSIRINAHVPFSR
jgi:hypothetical protein